MDRITTWTGLKSSKRVKEIADTYDILRAGDPGQIVMAGALHLVKFLGRWR